MEGNYNILKAKKRTWWFEDTVEEFQMCQGTKKLEDKDKVPISAATHTTTSGIVYPPPDIKHIVDKTAQFVGKNGQDFEKRITLNNAGNGRFDFLNASDPYHTYYLHLLAQVRLQNDASRQQ
ncbi:putative splicing factor 3a subunit 1 [Nicotiana attenuata]|uniref:Splicing factor 3a subunit 1 n=1 Tax=Nicotiana attenuata TaxID=49451 RepID=A0A314KZV9_NICAT|nr:putative splicing factor 3a subunit 1 [Nicotiana attenuata]